MWLFLHYLECFLTRAVIDVFPCRHIGSKLRDMSVHYQQYTDTFSILNYLQNHCLWRKKKRSKIGPILSRKFQITYKIIVCGEKMVKIGTILSNKLPTGLPARFNDIQHKGDILPRRTCGDFYVSFVYRYCHEQLTCRIVPWIFRQSIISTIDNSTIPHCLGLQLTQPTSLIGLI